MARPRFPRPRLRIDTDASRIRRPAVPSPGVPVPVPAEPAVRSPNKARLRREVKQLLAKVRNVEAEFYAVGLALKKLDRPEVPEALGHATFRAFVEAEVMGYDRAYRYMTVAEAYPKRLALSLGVEKAFHLVQYERVMKTRTSAQAMAERDRRIGANRERISELTALEVQNLVRAGRLRAAQAERPKVTRRERSAAAKLGRAFEAQFGVDATVRVDKKRDVVRIEVRLADLLE